MQPKPRYWFPAKEYGWGWGPPCAWQGWVVLITFLCLVLGGVFLFFGRNAVVTPDLARPAYLAYSAILTCVLVAICYVKGEPPGWRWGGRNP